MCDIESVCGIERVRVYYFILVAVFLLNGIIGRNGKVSHIIHYYSEITSATAATTTTTTTTTRIVSR